MVWDQPFQPWLWGSAMTCCLCPLSPSLSQGAALGGGKAAQEQHLPWRCPPVVPPRSALPFPSSVISLVPSLFMSSTLVLFLFHFPLVFSAVLSLVLCLGLPYIPRFVLNMSLLHLCLLVFLYSPCVFFCLRSLSFIISFDFLLPLLLFLHS